MPEIRAQCRNDPYRRRACQSGEELNKQPPILRADARDGEQFLQLIDYKNELGILEDEKAARPAFDLGQAPEGIGKQKTWLGTAQMPRELRGVLPWRDQFRQSGIGLGTTRD